MSNYGIRHDPKVIAIAILSMIFPGVVEKKILREAGIEVSGKTLQRIRSEVKELGIGKLIGDAHKMYLLTTVESQLDFFKLKNYLFNIISSSESSNIDKIQAAKVISDLIKNINNIHDPLLSETVSSIEDEKNSKTNATQKGTSKTSDDKTEPSVAAGGIA